MRKQPESDVQIRRGHGNEILGSLSSWSKEDNHILKGSATRYKYAGSPEEFDWDVTIRGCWMSVPSWAGSE